MKLMRICLSFLPAAALTLALATFGAIGMAHADSHAGMVHHGKMHVTKSPTCGCCGAWVALARNEGYDVAGTDVYDVTDTKLQNRVPAPLWSCHTAMIDGYVIEGHVPFAAIAKLLKDRPDIHGIAVPGMPDGSPGMGDDSAARFDVLAFGGDAGAGAVFFRAGQ